MGGRGGARAAAAAAAANAPLEAKPRETRVDLFQPRQAGERPTHRQDQTSPDSPHTKDTPPLVPRPKRCLWGSERTHINMVLLNHDEDSTQYLRSVCLLQLITDALDVFET